MAAMTPTHLKKTKDQSFPSIAFCAGFDSSTGRLFLGASDFGVHSLDWTTEKPEVVRFEGEGHNSYVTGLARVESGLVTSSYDGTLVWWNTDSNTAQQRIEAHEKWVRNVVATPDGTRLCSVADDMHCKVWDAADGRLIHDLEGHESMTPHHYPSMLYTCCVSSDSRLLATADRVGRVVVWDLESGQQLATVEAPTMYTWDPKQRRHSIGGIRSVQFSPDGHQLAVGGIGKIGNIDHLGGPSRLEVFDWQKSERLHETENSKYKGLIERLVFAEDGSWLCAAGGDNGGFVAFYNPTNGETIHQDKAPMHVHDIAFSDDYSRLYAVGHQKIAEFGFPVPEVKPEPEGKPEAGQTS